MLNMTFDQVNTW